MILTKNKKGVWCFTVKNKKYSLAPPEIVDILIDPNIFNFDEIVKYLVKLKNLTSDSLELTYSQDYIPNADLNVEYLDDKFDGVIFEINSLKHNFIKSKVWSCKYIFMFFEKCPKKLYIKLENYEQFTK